ncbi:Jerky -like [Araneus ventricosus]|uniref:Jerky-like n=1 Tax=Araneus ventricosus TaxID=182803 RepID=A0A4Y2HQN8_ARAVE|nr:Jerky -like [Araneus ventricosus]
MESEMGTFFAVCDPDSKEGCRKVTPLVLNNNGTFTIVSAKPNNIRTPSQDKHVKSCDNELKVQESPRIRQLSIVGETLSSDIEAGNSFIAELQKLIVKEKINCRLNCDETWVYRRALPTKPMASENEAVAPGRKKLKDRVTILGCANASGSHRVKLTLVGKSKKPRCFKNINKASLPLHYMHQKSACMNPSLFSEWFHDCFVPEVKKNLKKLKLKKAILLMDNAPDHTDVETLKAGNITCIFTPPNTTAILQSMDQALVESTKRSYRKQISKQISF